MSKQEKIRIRLKGYDHKAIDQSAAKIVETAKSNRTHSLRADSAPYREECVYHSSFSACQQGQP